MTAVEILQQAKASKNKQQQAKASKSDRVLARQLSAVLCSVSFVGGSCGRRLTVTVTVTVGNISSYMLDTAAIVQSEMYGTW